MDGLWHKTFQAVGFALLNLSEGHPVEIAGQEFGGEDFRALLDLAEAFLGKAREATRVAESLAEEEPGAGPVEHIEEPCEEHLRAVAGYPEEETPLHLAIRKISHVTETAMAMNRELLEENRRLVSLSSQMNVAHMQQTQELVSTFLRQTKEIVSAVLDLDPEV